VGLPAGLDVSSSPSLGLQLVRMLATQLGAELEVAATGGTTIRLTVRGEG
jgi:two-component sensor histidine kinase